MHIWITDILCLQYLWCDLQCCSASSYTAANMDVARPVEVSPLISANIFSKITFSWVHKLFIAREGLTDEHLFPLHPQDTSTWTSEHLQQAWQEEVKTRGAQKASLARAYVRVFGWSYFKISVFVLVKAVFVLAQCQFLGLLLEHLQERGDVATGYLYALGLVLTAIVGGQLHHIYFFQAWRAGMRWRAAAQALIFSKSLTLSMAESPSSASSDSSGSSSSGGGTQQQQHAVGAGHVVNLASTDIERFQKLSQMLSYIAYAPVEVGVILWLLYREVSHGALAGLAAMTLLIVIQGLFSRAFGTLRHDTAVLTDERVRVTGQVIAGSRVLKMAGWEPPFLAAVKAVRDREVRVIQKSNMLRAVNEALFSVAPLVVGAATFLTAWAIGVTLSSRRVFVTMSLFAFLQADLSKFFVVGLESIAEIDISFQRLKALLLQPEAGQGAPNTVAEAPGASAEVADADAEAAPENLAVRLRNVNCSWSEKRSLALKDVNLDVLAGELVAVVGEVGSGKSSLLLLLLNELRAQAGAGVTVAVTGRIAYVSQTPWILTGSFRENIVLGASFDAARYAAVLDACGLQRDLQHLSAGDATTIGERGINLSGGQRARLSLARCCYQAESADVFLLDDVLSALDAAVGRRVFESCVCGLLRHKTRIMVTHQLQYVRAADRVVVMSHGSILLQGSFQAVASAHAAAAASPDGSAVGAALAEVFATGSEQAGNNSTSSNSGSGATSGGDSEEAAVVSDLSDTPLPDNAGSSTPAAASSSETSSSNAHSAAAAATKAEGGAPKGLIQAESMAKGSVKGSVYLRYWASAGGPLVVLYLAILMAAGSTIFTLSSVYLAKWAGLPAAQQQEAQPVIIYGALVAASLGISLIRSVAFFRAAVSAAFHIHNAAFARIICATLLFFDSNPAGRILNRFSRDLGVADDSLPITFFDLLNALLAVLSTLALVFAVNPWLLIAVTPLAVAFFQLRKYYMVTARAVKRLESVTRSPVFSLMGECLNGLPVLRAFKLQPMLMQRYYQAADANFRAYFAFISTSRWLGVRLDAMCFLLLIATTFACVALADELPASIIGVALSYVLTVTNTFQWMVRQSSEVENAMVAVERLLEYAEDTPVEDVALTDAQRAAATAHADTAAAQQQHKQHKQHELAVHVNPLHSPVPAGWPNSGAVTFNSVVMRYRPGLQPALRGVSFNIPGGSRVGIVGRSGAGKSSILLSFLRLVEPERHPLSPAVAAEAGLSATATASSGVAPGGCGICIDGVDIASVSLTALRAACSVVPQEPVIFVGSVRTNLDPFVQHTDNEVLAALQAVQLARFVQAHGGLNMQLTEGGSNLSVGQRQLLNLARAVLRRSKVLVADEPTAATDSDTDAAIQTAIRTAFKGSTIITIAHRLDTIIDCDVIVVMDAGKAVEVGSPHQLLSKGAAASPFAALVAETGPRTAAQLALAAAEAEAEARRAGAVRGGE